MKFEYSFHSLWSSLFLALIFFCSTVQAYDLKPYKIQYKSKIRGFNIKTIRQLTQNDDHYELTQTIKAMFVGTEETSTFKLNSDKLIPQTYLYDRSIFGHETIRVTHFNPATRSASFQEKKDPAIEIHLKGDDIYDPLNAHIPLRMLLMKEKDTTKIISAVKVLKKKRVREFSYNILGTEWMETPLGYMETLKVERSRSKKNKNTTIWLAKNWDYIVVKIAHSEPGEPTYEMNIVKGKIGGKKIMGRDTSPVNR